MGASSIHDGMLIGPVLHWSCAHALSPHEFTKARELYQIQKAYFCYMSPYFLALTVFPLLLLQHPSSFRGSEAVVLFRPQHPTLLSTLASYELQSGHSLVPHRKSESLPILQL